MSLIARLLEEDGRLVLCAPAVGLWREFPAKGSLVLPGASIGRLEILGRLVPLLAPDGAEGLVVALGGEADRARRPVAFGDRLVVLDPEVTPGQLVASERGQATSPSGALVFASPTHGRFYARPSPDKPPFVKAGDLISEGQTVALLEVMKTFHRVSYGGPGLPSRATVVRVVPEDGADLESGDPILELEPTE